MLFQDLKFIFSWRNYQQRFLDAISDHLTDNHLHVIAPPGSGKTILGLELTKRLGKKTLVLTPTLTIRNQWQDRLVTFFSGSNEVAFSFDLEEPGDITFITYQALHAFYKKFTTVTDYFTYFEKSGIEVLVLDEAHHLKNEWWKALYELKEQLCLTVVALTATPPMDSGLAEVKKYFQLCNDVDVEIVVPDLIKEGDLCPHQDYVHFSVPNKEEAVYIDRFRKGITNFITELLHSEGLQKVLRNHRFYLLPEVYWKEIYESPDYLSAILIGLNAMEFLIPEETLRTLGFKEDEQVEFPDFNLKWITVLLEYLLLKDRENLVEHESVLKDLEAKLRKAHGLKNKQIDLTGDRYLHKTITGSANKLQSIIDIVTLEYESLQEDLRAVILTDYIRDEYLNIAENEVYHLKSLGAVPIFQKLRIRFEKKEGLAVLTGTVVIVHKKLETALGELGGKENLNFTALTTDADFLLCRAKSSVSLVTLLTDLFQQGKINVLIGTKSLLGEGWDAPAINTLILASFVGSFVSSNQMRGRAIRTNKNNPDKTGNIWHLVCLDPTDDEGGYDMKTLKRRFDAFLGVSYDGNQIQNGIERLGLDSKIEALAIDKLNENTIDRAKRRDELVTVWKEATFNGNGLSKELHDRLLEKDKYVAEKRAMFNHALKSGWYNLGITMGLAIPGYMVYHLNGVLLGGFTFYLIAGLLIAGGGYFLSKGVLAARDYWRFGNWYKDIKGIGNAVLFTLYELNYMDTPMQQVTVAVKGDLESEIVFSISGCSNYESTLFINTLREVLDPIDNPRYLIVKNFYNNKALHGYFAVPELFGGKKANSAVFLKHWIKQVGTSKLIYTRNEKGRQLLLNARLKHITNVYQRGSSKSVIWE